MLQRTSEKDLQQIARNFGVGKIAKIGVESPQRRARRVPAKHSQSVMMIIYFQ